MVKCGRTHWLNDWFCIVFVLFENTVFQSVMQAGQTEKREESHREGTSAGRLFPITKWLTGAVSQCVLLPACYLIYELKVQIHDIPFQLYNPVLRHLPTPPQENTVLWLISSIGLGHQLVGEDTSEKKLVSGILLEEIFDEEAKSKIFLMVLAKLLTNWETPPSIHFNLYQLRRNTSTLYPIMCHIAHMWNKIEQIYDFINTFFQRDISPHGKQHDPSFEQAWTPFIQGRIMPS